MTSTIRNSYQIPVTSFSITVPNWANMLIIDPAGTLAAGTITMPPNPIPGQVVKIYSTKIVTALTHSANTGQTLVGGLTALVAGALGGTWTWCAETQTWYPS